MKSLKKLTVCAVISLVAFSVLACRPAVNKIQVDVPLVREDPPKVDPPLPPTQTSIVDLGDFLPKDKIVGDILYKFNGGYGTHINNDAQVGGYYSSSNFNGKTNFLDTTEHAFLYTSGKSIEYPAGMARCGDIGDGGLMAGDNELANGAVLYEHGKLRKVMADYRVVKVNCILYNKDGIQAHYGEYGDGATSFLQRGRTVGFQYDVKTGHLEKYDNKVGDQNALAESCPCMNLNSTTLHIPLNIRISTKKREGIGSVFTVGSMTIAVINSIPRAGESKATNVTLEPLAGAVNCHITSINSDGAAIGYCDDSESSGDFAPEKCQGFLYSNGMMVALPSLGGGYIVPNAINKQGEIVGVSATVGGEKHAFLYRQGKMTDLNDIDQVQGKGWKLDNATGINDHSQICGGGTHNSTTRTPFLLTLPH